jgi:hypothetical protein
VTTIADLLVRMDVDSARFRAQLDKAEKQLDQLNNKVNKSSKSLDDLFKIGKLSLGGLSVGKVANEMAQFAVHGAESADALGKLAEQSNTNIEQFSRLAYGAEIADVSSEELGKGLNKLAKEMIEAQTASSPAAAAFDALGVATKDSTGQLRPLDAVLRDIADRFSKAEDGAAKIAITQELISKSTANWIPYLNQGVTAMDAYAREADEVAFTLDEKTAAAAAQLDEDMNRLRLTSEGLSRHFAAQLAPAGHEAADMFLAVSRHMLAADRYGAALKTTINAVSFVFRTLVADAVLVAQVLEITGQQIGMYAAALADEVAGNFAGAKETLRQGYRDAAKIADDYDKLLRQIMNPRGDAGGWETVTGTEWARMEREANKTQLQFNPKGSAKTSEIDRWLADTRKKIAELEAGGALTFQADVLVDIAAIAAHPSSGDVGAKIREIAQAQVDAVNEAEAKLQGIKAPRAKKIELISKVQLQAQGEVFAKLKELATDEATTIQEEMQRLARAMELPANATEEMRVRYELASGKLGASVKAMNVLDKESHDAGTRIAAEWLKRAAAKDTHTAAVERSNQALARTLELNRKADAALEAIATPEDRAASQLLELDVLRRTKRIGPEDFASRSDDIRREARGQENLESVASRIREDTKTPQQRYLEELNNVEAALQRGRISQEQYNKAIEEAGKKFDWTKAAQAATVSAEEIGGALSASLADAFANLDAFFTNFDESAEKMVETFGRAILQMTARAAAANLTGLLFGGLGFGVKPAAPAAPAATSATAAAPYPASYIPGFASGGPVDRDQLILVGERGPELFVPQTSGKIVAHTELVRLERRAVEATHRMRDRFELSGDDIVPELRRLNEERALAGTGALFVPAQRALEDLVERRALGGPVVAGHPYFVGERGRELFASSTEIRALGELAASTSAASHVRLSEAAGVSPQGYSPQPTRGTLRHLLDFDYRAQRMTVHDLWEAKFATEVATGGRRS